MTVRMRCAGWASLALRAGFALAVLASCTTTQTDGGGTDSTTHWLERCSADEDCGRLSCLCGRCSTGCDDDAACARFGSSARCEATADSCSGSSARAAAMCVAPCDGPGDCAAVDADECSDGSCVSNPSDPPPPDADSGKGAPVAPLDAGSDSAALDAAGVLLGACGEPWYRCPDRCHGQLTLRGGGRQQLPCVDDCNFRLSIGPASLLADTPCAGQIASLSIQNVANDYRERTATLSEEAWSELARLSLQLEMRDLQPLFCADCAGVDNAWVTVPGSDQFESNLGYRSGAAPGWLREADAFVQALIDQLTACEGPLIRDCKDTTPAPGPDEPGPTPPSCNFVYTNQQLTAVSCTMPLDQSEPCRAAVTCMCGSDLLQPGRADQAFCEESWLTPRGAITFSDFCGDGPAQATRTLSEALQLFAAAYQEQVVVQPECDEMSAYY